MTNKKPAPNTPTKKKTTPQTTRKHKPRTPPAIADVQRSVPDTLLPEPIEIARDDGLTDRQRVFIEQYLCCWNATEAARRAGYKDPHNSAYDNQLKPAVRSAIERRLAEHKASADEVLARLTEHATGDMGDFLSTILMEDGLMVNIIDLSKARRAGKLNLIRRFSVSKDSTTIELYDALAALQLLGRHYELFADKDKITHSPPIAIPQLKEMLDKVYGPQRDLNFPVKTA